MVLGLFCVLSYETRHMYFWGPKIQWGVSGGGQKVYVGKVYVPVLVPRVSQFCIREMVAWNAQGTRRTHPWVKIPHPLPTHSKLASQGKVASPVALLMFVAPKRSFANTARPRAQIQQDAFWAQSDASWDIQWVYTPCHLTDEVIWVGGLWRGLYRLLRSVTWLPWNPETGRAGFHWCWLHRSLEFRDSEDNVAESVGQEGAASSWGICMRSRGNKRDKPTMTNRAKFAVFLRFSRIFADSRLS